MLHQLVETVEREAWADLYARMPEPLAAGLGRRVERHGEVLVLCAPPIPGGEFNRAFPLGLAEDDDTRVDAVIAAMRAAGSKPVLQVVPGASRVETALRERGFAPFVEWVKLAHDGAPQAVAGPDVREVGRDEAGKLAAAIAGGFGMPPPIQAWLVALVDSPGWHGFLVEDGDRPIGGAFLWVNGATAWLGIGAVLPTARGLGAQRALIAARMAAGRALGVETFVTETGDLPGQKNVSLANLRACGFRDVHRRAGWRE